MDGRRGWWVVLGGFAAMSITSGVSFFVLPGLLESIIEDTGWSLDQVSLGVTIFGLVAAVYSPFCGVLIDRHGARPMMFFGVALVFAASLALGYVSALWQFYAAMVVYAVGGMSCTFIPVAAVIARWFIHHRGMATGLAMLGIGVGGGVYPQLVGWLLESRTWHEVYVVMAFTSLAAFLPLALWIRNPSAAIEAEAEVEEADATIRPDIDLRLGAAMKTRSFWGLSLGDALTGTIFAIFNVQLILFLTKDLGGDAATATNVFSTLMICLALGTLICGALGDRFPLRVVMFTCYLIPALAAFLLLPRGMAALAFTFAVVAGLAGGGRNALFPVALVHSFGGTHMAAIYGLSNSFFMIGNGLGPLLGAALYGEEENTKRVYGVCIVVLVVSAFLVALIRPEFGETRREVLADEGIS